MPPHPSPDAGLPPEPTSRPTDAPATADDERRPIALRALGPVELTSLLAFSMALAALGIDTILPAFPEVRDSFGLGADSNATAGIVTAYFLGLAGGQLLYGVLADALGRRRALYVGYVVYLLGAVASALAPSFGLLLAARVLWGVGAAGGRVVTLAVIRDTWSGDRMSRAMSFVMAVFIIVPIIAPTLGAGITAVADWRWVFWVCAAAVVAVSMWAFRLPETLAEEHRVPLQADRLVRAARAVFRQRVTIGCGLAMTSLYGVFTSWIASSELIITDVFGRGEQFPLVFGGLAAALGAAMLLNARLVDRLGTRRVTRIALTSYIGMSVALLLVALATGGVPAFWVFAPVLAVLLGSHALLVPNINSMAMEPVGHVAGTASSVIGAMQIAGGAVLGSVLDRLFDGTITPMAVGFVFYGVVCAVLLSRSGALSDASSVPAEAVPA